MQKHDDSKELKMISPWGYIGYTLLLSIPVLGFILLIVFSFSKKRNLRNWARSFWCWLLVLIITLVLIAYKAQNLFPEWKDALSLGWESITESVDEFRRGIDEYRRDIIGSNRYRPSSTQRHEASAPATATSISATSAPISKPEYEMAFASAQSTYQIALQNAQGDYLATLKEAKDTYKAALRNMPDAETIAKAQDTYEAVLKKAQDTYEATLEDAQDAYQAALREAEASIGNYVAATPSVTAVPTLSSTSTPTPTPTATQTPVSNGVTPSFKKMMDTYEAFFDEYVDFMKSFSNGTSDIGLLMKYANFMSKYARNMDELEKLEDTEEMTKADTDYFIDVYARILKKLTSLS